MRRAATAILAVMVLFGAAVVVIGSSSASTANRRAAATQSPRGAATLVPQLRRFLAGKSATARPRVVVPRNVQAAPTTCYVAAGSCSLTPCIEFAGGTVEAVALSSPTIVKNPAPTRACSGRRGAPRVVRVVGP
jgi:hypothetical protein